VLIPKEDIPATVAKILGKDVAEVEAMLVRVSERPYTARQHAGTGCIAGARRWPA